MDSDDIVERLRLLWTEPIEDAALYTAISKAADEIERLRAEVDECDQLRERMADILHRTADALHGGPLENGLWSWHDLPELAEEALHGWH